MTYPPPAGARRARARSSLETAVIWTGRSVLGTLAVLATLATSAPAQEAAPAEEAAPPPRVAGDAGDSTGVEATGWGGRKAVITWVEGVQDGAPLTLEEKPRPQNDWFISQFRSAPPTDLNPYVSQDPDASSIARYVLGRLVDVDPDSPPQVVPALAMSWEVSEDGKTCTYHLRKGVQFADGRSLTSADVEWSFAVLRDPATRADHMRPAFEKVIGVSAPDDHTVVATFSRAHWKAPYLIGRSLLVLNKGWYEEQIPKFAKTMGDGPVSTIPGQPGFARVFNEIPTLCPGTGPYQLASEFDFSRQHVHLTPNPFSWQMQVHPGRHNFSALRWVPLDPGGPDFFAFVRGDLDVWVVSHDAWENQLSRDPRVDAVGTRYVYDHIGIDCSSVAWNCRRPPFDDPHVRRAMTFLIDRQTILDGIEQGHGQVASCKSKPSYPTYSRDIQPHPFDIAAAKNELTKAGWFADQDGDGVLDKDGKNLTFELTIPGGRRHFQRLAEIITKGCRAAGVGITINEVDAADYVRAARGFRFDAICGYSSWPDPWIDLYGQYHSKADRRGGGNVAGWHSKQADDLVERMQAELDDVERMKLHHEFNKLFHAEQPETLLIHGKVGVLVNKRFEGVNVRPTGLQIFDLWVRPENVRHGGGDPK